MITNKSILLTFLLSIVFLSNSWTQADTKRIIDAVEFQGLKRTQATYLKQFVQAARGIPFSDSLLQNDVQMLKNVASIGNAEYRIDTSSTLFKVIFEVEEVRTLLPIVNFGGIKGNVWFQLGFTDINWQGKGQFFSASYQNTDRRHAGNIYYRIPRINGTNWGFSASLSRWATREPLYFDEGAVNYDYDNNSAAVTVIRNFGFNRSLEVGGTYFVEKYAKSEQQFLETPPGPEDFTQPKLLSKIEYSENFLNYHFFYLKGLTWRITLQDVYNTIDQSWFHLLQFEGRKYNRIGDKGNFAARLKLGISTNNDTPFAPFVVDSHVNLRGVGNRIDRGTAQAVLNLEYRQTIYESKKWGAQLVAFSDLGTWRNPGGELSDLWDSDHFREFLGGGVRLIYNKIYGAVLRIDYGIDIVNKEQRGLVIGLGQYF